MRDQIEDAFLDWKEGLDTTTQELVHYEGYDSKLQTVFVYRLEGFDRQRLAKLEGILREQVSPHLLVSSLRELPA